MCGVPSEITAEVIGFQFTPRNNISAELFALQPAWKTAVADLCPHQILPSNMANCFYPRGHTNAHTHKLVWAASMNRRSGQVRSVLKHGSFQRHVPKMPLHSSLSYQQHIIKAALLTRKQKHNIWGYFCNNGLVCIQDPSWLQSNQV